MGHKTKFGVLIAVIVALLAFIIWGQQRLKTANEDAFTYKKALDSEAFAANSKDRLIKEKQEEIDVLKEQNKMLRDTIDALKSEVVRLNSNLRSQGKKILANQKLMKEMQIREDSLVKEIGRLLGLQTANRGAIAKMENERLEIGKNMSELYEENEYLKDSIVTETVAKEEVSEELALKKKDFLKLRIIRL
ncbi:MAG: hypothetical protein HC803_10420 [Saprospiraceae bacterium]|nr:hypothetical protein [Saprospiraceae bacterium]